MKKQNIIREKSFQFALDIVELCKRIKYDDKEYELSSQLIRSGTSIGANVEEAMASSSRKDFKHRMSIASREARESHYWLRILDQSSVTKRSVKHHLSCADELIRILTAIVKSSRT
jgi:four helix bundle protein